MTIPSLHGQSNGVRANQITVSQAVSKTVSCRDALHASPRLSFHPYLFDGLYPDRWKISCSSVISNNVANGISLTDINERTICSPMKSPSRAGASFENAAVKGASPKSVRFISKLLLYNILFPITDAQTCPSLSCAHCICFEE